MDGKFLRFLMTGSLAAIANFMSRLFLSRIMSYELAVILAYFVGMTVAFILAKMFVFTPSGRKAADEYTRFAIVNAVALVQIWIISVGLLRLIFPAFNFTWYPENVAHAIGLASTTFTSYWGHKHFSFSAQKSSQ